MMMADSLRLERTAALLACFTDEQLLCALLASTAGHAMIPNSRQLIRDHELSKVCGLASWLGPSRDTVSLYLLGFVLRHRLAQLSTTLDMSYRSAAPLLPEVWQATLLEVKTAWQPIVGFNSLGGFVQWQAPGLCRFIDAYDPGLCDQRRVGSYCPRHAAIVDDASSAPGFYTMRSFYQDINSVNAYSEVELDLLLAKFWHRLQAKAPSQRWSEAEISGALAVFGFATVESLTTLSVASLKKQYLQLCFASHPDRCGDQQQFHKVAAAYQVLRTLHSTA